METLYRLEIGGTDSDSGVESDAVVDARFVAHPSPGLNEPDVTQPVHGTVVLNSLTCQIEDLRRADLRRRIDMPDSLPDFTLYLNQSTVAVPEPAALLLLTAGAATTLRRRTRTA